MNSESNSSGKLDKLKLNNQIVSMRKDVRRARLWLINNLSGRSKKLLAKKGTEQQVAKNKRKAERFKLEIDVLKRIDIDDVSKFALSNKHDPTEVLKTLDKLPVEQRSMLRLATHKLVHNRVIKFREAYPVPLHRVILLIRALGVRYQKKKEKDLTKPNGKNKILTESSHGTDELGYSTESSISEDLESESLKADARVSEPVKKKITKSGPSKVAEKETKSVASEEVNKVKNEELVAPAPQESDDKHTEGVTDPTSTESTEETVTVKQDAQKKGKVKVKVDWPTLPAPVYERREGTMEIKQLKLSDVDDMAREASETSPIVSTDTDHTEVDHKPLDSFFLGGQSSDDEEEDSSQMKGRWNRKELEVNRRYQNFAKSEFSNPKRGDTQKSSKFATKATRKVDSRTQKPETKVPQLDEQNLHPSWQAKRKQKEQLNPVTAFQGKKIKFDDD